MQALFPGITVWKTPFRILVAMSLLSANTVAANSLAESVVRESPLHEVIEQYPAMMDQGIRNGLERTGQVPPFMVATIGHVVSRAYSVPQIRQQVVTDLDAGLDQQQLRSVLTWYESSLGQRISQAEVAAAQPSAWGKVEANGAALIEKYQGTERARLFDRFDRASGVTESAMDTTMAVQLSLASAMGALGGEQGSSAEQIRQRIESHRPALRRMVEHQVYAGYLQTYDKLSTGELEQYIRFLESGAGSSYVGVVTGSIRKAMLRPIETMGSQVVQIFGGG